MSACRPYLYMAAGCFTKMHGILHAEKRKPMGKIHNVEKMTDNRFVNLYHVDATSVHNTPVSYYVASRAKDVPALKLKTGRNDPDGVIIYSIYGQKKDKVVLVRQYRYTLGDYIYEFPAGLVEPGEDFAADGEQRVVVVGTGGLPAAHGPGLQAAQGVGAVEAQFVGCAVEVAVEVGGGGLDDGVH